MGNCKWLVLLKLLVVCVIGLENDHWGTYFIQSFPPCYSITLPKIIVVITAREQSDVVVTLHSTGREEKFSLTSGNLQQIEFGSEAVARPYGVKLEKLAVSVIASRKVSVYTYLYESAYTDGFLVLPVASLGTDYMIVNMHNMGTGSYSRTFIIIVAAEDNTTVNVTLKTFQDPTCWNSLTEERVNNGDVYTFNLNAYDVVNMYCKTDTTGSRINSSSPVAIITGSRFLSLPEGSKTDPAVEMLPPVSDFGTMFAFIAPHGQTSQKAMTRIVALNNGTSYTIKDITYTPAKGDPVDIWLNASDRICLEASDYISVMLFMAGDNETDEYKGDTYMSIVPPVTMATNDYMIPRGFLLDYDDGYVEGIDIVTIALPINSLHYPCYGFRVNISSGNQSGVTHYSDESPFIMLMYGYSNREAYGFPAGMKTSDFSGNNECSSSPCQNGGWCLETSYSFRCYCNDSRYNGTYCENDTVDDCIRSSCVYGTCIDHNKYFTCDCLPGYTGIYCDIELPTTQLTTKTQNLITEALATEDPTDEVLITDDPTTEVLVTEDPTEVLVTEDPTTIALATEDLTCVSLVTEDPTTEALVTEDLTEVLATEDPTIIAVATEGLTTVALATEDPTTETLVTEDPTTMALVTEDPTTQLITEVTPHTEGPTSKLTTERPQNEKPSTAIIGTNTSEAPVKPITFRPIFFKNKPCTGAVCLCSCPCQVKLSKNETLSNAEEQQRILKVDTTTLSKTRRKKQSSENQNRSENELGLGSVLVISTMFFGFVVIDLFPTFVWIWSRFKNSNEY